ncbi:MAG TPA: hypothetical protein VMM13_05900, partial [Euzebya sp.]|nr:hypothetical protein [Euzebya sp.]
MRSSASTTWLAAQTRRLTAHLGAGDRARLAEDPVAAVTGDGVAVRTGPVRPGECGLDGLYVHGDDGPVITYTPAASAGRNNFTILHEYGH